MYTDIYLVRLHIILRPGNALDISMIFLDIYHGSNSR